jgi:hypothetical protein
MERSSVQLPHFSRSVKVIAIDDILTMFAYNTP